MATQFQARPEPGPPTQKWRQAMKHDVYEKIAVKISTDLEQGVRPWLKPGALSMPPGQQPFVLGCQIERTAGSLAAIRLTMATLLGLGSRIVASDAEQEVLFPALCRHGNLRELAWARARALHTE